VRPTLSGRVVAVTGGARGIGLATARALRTAGATVVIGDIQKEALQAAAEGDLMCLPLDVTDERSFVDFVTNIEQVHGRLDVLVNNAGIMPVGPFTDYDEAVVDRTIGVDLIGLIRGCRIAVPGMLKRGSGHLINVASIAGRLPAPGLTIYNGAKFGVVGFTEALDAELSDRGIRASAILPSFTKTALIDGLDPRLSGSAATPEQVAHAIVGVVHKPQLHTYVPAAAAVANLTPLLPGRLKSWLLSRPSYASIFTEPDHARRTAYESEIRPTGATEPFVDSDDPRP